MIFLHTTHPTSLVPSPGTRGTLASIGISQHKDASFPGHSAAFLETREKFPFKRRAYCIGSSLLMPVPGGRSKGWTITVLPVSNPSSFLVVRKLNFRDLVTSSRNPVMLSGWGPDVQLLCCKTTP